MVFRMLLLAALMVAPGCKKKQSEDQFEWSHLFGQVSRLQGDVKVSSNLETGLSVVAWTVLDQDRRPQIKAGYILEEALRIAPLSAVENAELIALETAEKIHLVAQTSTSFGNVVEHIAMTRKSIERSQLVTVKDIILHGELLSPHSESWLFALSTGGKRCKTRVFLSNDDGETWVDVGDAAKLWEVDGTVCLPAIAHDHSGNLLVIGEQHNGERASLFARRSSDFGRSWTVVPSPPRNGATEQGEAEVAWTEKGWFLAWTQIESNSADGPMNVYSSFLPKGGDDWSRVSRVSSSLTIQNRCPQVMCFRVDCLITWSGSGNRSYYRHGRNFIWGDVRYYPKNHVASVVATSHSSWVSANIVWNKPMYRLILGKMPR